MCNPTFTTDTMPIATKKLYFCTTSNKFVLNEKDSAYSIEPKIEFTANDGIQIGCFKISHDAFNKLSMKYVAFLNRSQSERIQ